MEVFLAMSGGVDSAFAAKILKERGFKVRAFTFRLLKNLEHFRTPKICCSEENMRRAERIAESLSIPHHILDLTEEFYFYVIERFIEEYKNGRTPNPCILCNRHIKFHIFLKRALSLGAEKIATGHYARIEEENGEYLLKKGIDEKKDQSYFLYPIKKEYLKYILFPLGSFKKEEVKETFGGRLSIIESQDLCFVSGNLKEFLKNFLKPKEGPIYFIDGRLLGYHEGIYFYTIGQRKGLGIPYKYPLYVIEIRKEDNAIIVGPREYLEGDRLSAKEVNFLYPSKMEVKGKIRYNQKEEPCKYEIEGDHLFVQFERPIYAITKGQSVVLYSRDTVIGGGVIL